MPLNSPILGLKVKGLRGDRVFKNEIIINYQLFIINYPLISDRFKLDNFLLMQIDINSA